MIKRKTWEEFKDIKLLWWINRLLHIFGWAIVYVIEKDGRISDIYPARVQFRGFSIEDETDGFDALTKYLAKNSAELLKEIKIPEDVERSAKS